MDLRGYPAYDPTDNAQYGYPGDNPARRGQGYRKLWQRVSQVSPGDSAIIVSDCTVEDMLRAIKALPQQESAVDAVRAGIGYLDSRALAFLFKELGKSKLTHRAFEIFDWLNNQQDADLANLCDVFTYTTIISQCGSPRLLWKALWLVGYMKSKGVACNTHTYSALMSACVKAKQAALALEVFEEMTRDGLKPSVVTFNTLIDAYGKLGMWREAVQVIDMMVTQGMKAESRTYVSVIRACVESKQPDEAYKVYQRTLKIGEKPTGAVLTLIMNAYCERGRVLEAMNVLNELCSEGCERTPATYSQILETCEKSGHAQFVRLLKDKISKDGFQPEQVRAAKSVAGDDQADKHSRPGNGQPKMQDNPKPVFPSRDMDSAQLSAQFARSVSLAGPRRADAYPPVSGYAGVSANPGPSMTSSPLPLNRQQQWEHVSPVRQVSGRRVVYYNGQLVELD